MRVMFGLNVKCGQDNYMLNQGRGIHGVGACNDNGQMFVDYRSKSCHKVSWISPSRRTSNQIDHFAYLVVIEGDS